MGREKATMTGANKSNGVLEWRRNRLMGEQWVNMMDECVVDWVSEDGL